MDPIHNKPPAAAGATGAATGDYRPAAYGRACKGCSKAKCKCFFRAEGSGCERCYRLGKTCEPSVAVRARKSRPGAARQQPQQPQADLAKQSRLEEKLDQIVSLLSTADQRSFRSGSTPADHLTPESLTSTAVGSSPDHVGSTGFVRMPDAVVDVTSGMVQLLRPGSSDEEDFDDDDDASLDGHRGMPSAFKMPSPVLADIAGHHVPENVATERLDTFRTSFLPIYPLVHLPAGMSPTELRLRRPFLWLVIMAMASKSVPEQFRMEETIWRIISRRAIREHHDSVDLLLGIMIFTAWNCFFKDGRPFMTILSGVCVALAGEIGIQRPRPVGKNLPKFRLENRQNTTQDLSQQAKPPLRLEERRTLLATFRISSQTWKAYRKAEPMRWTPYMEDCLRVLSESGDSPYDALLVAQVKCDRINNELLIAQADALMSGTATEVQSQSSVLASAMLRQLDEIRQALPRDLRDTQYGQIVLLSCELTIRDACTQTSPVALAGSTSISVTSASMQRLRDLDAFLTCAVAWFDVWNSFSPAARLGWSSESHSAFFHACVVLFKLTSLGYLRDPADPASLPVPGWEAADVLARANVGEIVERTAAAVEEVPAALSLVDTADGTRSGSFFKIPNLLRGIGALLQSELDQLSGVAAKPVSRKRPEDEYCGAGLGVTEQQRLPYPEELLKKMATLQPDPLSSVTDNEYTNEVEMTDYLMTAMHGDPWFQEIFGPEQQWDMNMDLGGLSGSGVNEQMPVFAGWEGQAQGFPIVGWPQ